MEFIYSNYTSSVETLTNQFYSDLTGSLGWSANSGIISRLDLLPQSGSLSVLEVNTLTALWGHNRNRFDFTKFTNYLTSNNYNNLEFHEEKNDAGDSYPIYEHLSSSLSTLNISSSLHLYGKGVNPTVNIETEKNTTYKLYNAFPANSSSLHHVTTDKQIMRNTLTGSYFIESTPQLNDVRWATSSDFPDLVIKKGCQDSSNGIFFFDFSELTNHDSEVWNVWTGSYQAFAERYIDSDSYNGFSVVMGSHAIVGNDSVMTINNYPNNNYNVQSKPIKGNSNPFLDFNLDDGEVDDFGNVSQSWSLPSVESIIETKLNSDCNIEMSDGTTKKISNLSIGDSVKCYTTSDSIKYMESFYSDNFNHYHLTSSVSQNTSGISNSTSLSTESKTVHKLVPIVNNDLVTIDSKVKIAKYGSIFAKPNGESNYRMVAVHELIQDSFVLLNNSGNDSSNITTDMVDSNSNTFNSIKIIFDGDTNHYQKRFFNINGYLVLEC